MKKENLMCNIFNFSVATYYKRKKANNKAILFIEKYLSKEDMQELIDTGNLSKLERLQELEEIEKKYKAISEIIK